jgi:hypothetical protein
MSDDRPTRETMSVEEATISNMWEIAAIVEVLERKGLCTKQDLYDIITEFRRKNPRARIPETAFPEPYLLTETENKVNDDILELLNKHGLTSHQCKSLGRSARTQFSLYPRPFKLVFRAAPAGVLICMQNPRSQCNSVQSIVGSTCGIRFNCSRCRVQLVKRHGWNTCLITGWTTGSISGRRSTGSGRR